jgi:glycosyltransferase involved in cell wall biosynthesis
MSHRIAYVAHLNERGSAGAAAKIAAQAQLWGDRGHEVRVFVFTRDDPVAWRSRLPGAVVHGYRGGASRLTATTRLVRSIRRYAPAVVYLRWDLFYPPMLWFPRRASLVIEINTDDLSEYALGSPIRALYNAWTRGLLLRRARGLVFVTGELSRLPAFRGLPGRRCVIGNGIDLDAYVPLPAPAGDRPRIVFVGTGGQPWHGVDKLLVLASLRPEWRIDVVGTRDETQTAPSNITWHGPLGRSGVLEALARADVGIGTLALHRNGMDEACPLKVREYLAVGLPVIYAYGDPDMDCLGEYALRIPNTERNVEESIELIDAFVRRVRGRRVPRAAVAHLDVGRKEEQRLTLFDELALA